MESRLNTLKYYESTTLAMTFICIHPVLPTRVCLHFQAGLVSEEPMTTSKVVVAVVVTLAVVVAVLALVYLARMWYTRTRDGKYSTFSCY